MPSQEPSDLLVSLTFRVRSFWTDPKLDARDRDRWLEDARASAFSLGRPEPHDLRPDEILHRTEKARAVLQLPNTEITGDGLIALLHAVQLLDAWHRPIANDLSGEQWQVMPDAHLDAQTRLLTTGAFNSNTDLGILVPRYGPDWRLCPDDWIESEIAKEYEETFDDSVHLDLRPYLPLTSVLPRRIEASAPDDGRGPPREVELQYVTSPTGLSIQNRTQSHRILVAPVLEAEGEVAIELSSGKYFVRPLDLPDKIDALVDAAFNAEGSVLFMPEMALSKVSFDRLCSALAKEHGEWSRVNGRVPHLAYAIVGVIEDDADSSRNYVAVLSGSGDILARQDKMSRWDLNPEAQRWLGLGHDDDDLADVIEEAIVPAPSVNLIELPGLGRLMVLICADMNIGEPGDFLYVNGGVDWVYAPIMDRTWRLQRDGTQEGWIVERSLRAAKATKGNVVVTNSIPLTAICNRTNKARGKPFAPSDSCQIALLIDGRDDSLSNARLEIPLGENQVIAAKDWFDGWEPFVLP